MSQGKPTKNALQNGINQFGLSLVLCSLLVACGPKSTRNNDVRRRQNSAALDAKQPPTAPKTGPKPANKIASSDPVKPAEKPVTTETPSPKFNLAGVWQSPCVSDE